MRLLILGGDGMLGHKLMQTLQHAHEVTVTLRRDMDDYAPYGLFNRQNSIDHVDIRHSYRLTECIAAVKPQVVINAIGLVKQREASANTALSLEVNALLPHRLSVMCASAGAKLIHFSTDCVFKGDKGNYSESDIADAPDVYGRTKHLGEVDDAHCLTLRTSLIGLELHRKRSLIEWFLQQKGETRGYSEAIFTGLTTHAIGQFIAALLCDGYNISGIYNLASQAISKYDLLASLTEKLGRTDITLNEDTSFKCNRSLDGSRLSADHGYVAPDWNSMLDQLAMEIRERASSKA